MKIIVVALGGNALIGKGQTGSAKEQLENLRAPMRQITQLSKDHRVIIARA